MAPLSTHSSFLSDVFFQISTMDRLPIIDAPKHCAICILTFQGEEAFEKHQSKLHRKGDIECEYCYKRFSRKEYLSRHIKTIHLALKEDAECHKCNRKFSDKERLTRHDVFMYKNFRLRAFVVNLKYFSY